jgi:quercetin dioxygenase-like cupin family protein
MTQTEKRSGKAFVLGREDGESFWQPVPANGFVRNLLNDEMTGATHRFSMSVQTVAAGCFIREHTHDQNEEIIFVASGKGSITLDGEDRSIEAGSCVFLGYNRKHQWNNPGPEPLSLLIFFLPGGLDKFHKEIGKPKLAGENPPAPFARPDNIAEIEARTVFGWTDLDFENAAQAVAGAE